MTVLAITELTCSSCISYASPIPATWDSRILGTRPVLHLVFMKHFRVISIKLHVYNRHGNWYLKQEILGMVLYNFQESQPQHKIFPVMRCYPQKCQVSYAGCFSSPIGICALYCFILHSYQYPELFLNLMLSEFVTIEWGLSHFGGKCWL